MRRIWNTRVVDPADVCEQSPPPPLRPRPCVRGQHEVERVAQTDAHGSLALLDGKRGGQTAQESGEGVECHVRVLLSSGDRA